jgi:hypothetical protein
MPHPNETERALMSLLQQERTRNSTQQAAVPALPELDLSMFLSPAAQREVAAMQGIPQTLLSEDIQANRQELTIRPSTVPVAMEEINLLSTNWDITEKDLEPSPRYSTESVEPDLANLFMDRALRETGMSPVELRRAERLGVAVEDIQFGELGGDIDLQRSMSPAQRSTGGVEVARRGPSGFSPISRQEAVARQLSTAQSAAQPKQAAPPPAPSGPVRNRYERLLGPSIID